MAEYVTINECQTYGNGRGRTAYVDSVADGQVVYFDENENERVLPSSAFVNRYPLMEAREIMKEGGFKINELVSPRGRGSRNGRWQGSYQNQPLYFVLDRKRSNSSVDYTLEVKDKSDVGITNPVRVMSILPEVEDSDPKMGYRNVVTAFLKSLTQYMGGFFRVYGNKPFVESLSVYGTRDAKDDLNRKIRDVVQLMPTMLSISRA